MSARSVALSIRALLLAALLTVLSQAVAADPIKTDVTINTAGGYARLVFNFADVNDADVRMSTGVLVITFKNAVEVDVDKLTVGNEYISAARRDPDGKGVRFALMQRVRVSAMTAGERLFVDLLPESWTAAPPPLPKEVVEDLARRAREAEKKAAQNQELLKQREKAATRVRVTRQPTFVRYIFELPEFISVNADRGRDKLTLMFDALLRFDLADAKLAQPPIVGSIETKATDSATWVIISLVGRVDIRSFREDNNYIVDFLTGDSSSRSDEPVLPPGVRAAAAAPVSPGEPRLEPGLARVIDPNPDKPRAVAEALEKVTQAGPPPVTAPALETPPSVAAPVAETPPPAVAPPPPPAPREQAAKPSAPQQQAKMAATPPQSGVIPMSIGARGDSLRLLVPFNGPTAAAVFLRADTLWLVFDTGTPIDVAGVAHDSIRDASVIRQSDAQIVRLKLDRPRLISVEPEENTWIVHLGDSVIAPPQPLNVIRNVSNMPRASAHIPFDEPRRVHRITDPDVGDTLVLVTAGGPARGIAKSQDFVDFRALSSAQGVVIQPMADDLKVEIAADRVMIGRPGGLTLTSAAPAGQRGGMMRTLMFDPQQWGFDRQANFLGRSASLIAAAAAANEAKRVNARMDLARFLFARDMYAEAKGVLDAVLEEDRPNADDTAAIVMRGVAKILMGRPDEGLKDINSPVVGNQNDAQIWRALASAKQGKWSEAREGFRKIEVALGMLPIELQREVLKEAVRASIEVGDFAGAATQLAEFETLGVPADIQPSLAVLGGRIHEGLGRGGEALIAYREAADSQDRAAAAQGRLREIALRFRTGDIKRTEVISELETLTAIWRGDETEIEALQMLAKLYLDEARFRDAFNVMRTAMKVHPHSELTRGIQDDAAAAFDRLFLGGKGDSLPAIEALSLFYDFRELVPIGRRGDEMIRRLSDRLVLVDLLDQAAELLQHQIDHRLQGAARAQVATRLAAIYLMNRKPERSIAVLKATRSSELPNEIRNQRLLLEARALSDTGRPNVALEVMEHIEGPEAIRARSDVLWSAKRYREAAEQIELMLGDRWRDFQPLTDTERRDILRAALGFNFGEDQIGLDRFREKYAPGMSQSPDRRAFEVVTAPQLTASDEFNEVARAISSTDTLDQFLADIRARFQDAMGPSVRSSRQPSHTRLRGDPATTGSIARVMR